MKKDNIFDTRYKTWGKFIYRHKSGDAHALKPNIYYVYAYIICHYIRSCCDILCVLFRYILITSFIHNCLIMKNHYGYKLPIYKMKTL